MRLERKGGGCRGPMPQHFSLALGGGADLPLCSTQDNTLLSETRALGRVPVVRYCPAMGQLFYLGQVI